jgi:protein-S-isoprenylcysteine O-methyltransferase Ste14
VPALRAQGGHVGPPLRVTLMSREVVVARPFPPPLAESSSGLRRDTPKREEREGGRASAPKKACATGVGRDLLARAVVGVLFTLLSVNLLADFQRTGHVTGLLLLASEALVVVLTIVRRRTLLVDRSMAAAAVTALSMAGPPLVRTAAERGLAPDAVTALLSGVGLSLVVVGKMTLGRSFGIAPANRGVVSRGPYVLVRHPIYTGYLITHIAFVLAHPRPWNLLVLAVADAALVVRALIEERVLGTDVDYQAYCRRVGWHLVPGVF